jgi:hypothetical protein
MRSNAWRGSASPLSNRFAGTAMKMEQEVCLENHPIEATKNIPESPARISLPGSLSEWRRLVHGIRCKQAALLVLMTAPLFAALAWQAGWRPIWFAPLVILAVAATIDFLGRVLVWTSSIGDRRFIGASVAAQATGLIAAIAFIVCVPTVGLQIGLTVAAISQAFAATMFTYYLIELGNYLGDAGATRAATRTLFGIVAVLVSAAGMGGIMLLLIIFLVLFVVLTCGIGFYYLGFFALALGKVVLFVSTVPLVYSIVEMFRHYARVLARIQTAIATTEMISDAPTDRPDDSNRLELPTKS